MEYYCDRNEWGCDNRVADEGETCDPCTTEERATAAYWKARYDRDRGRLTKAEVLDAYSHPTDAAKRQRMERDYK